jgi:hypothetical protein
MKIGGLWDAPQCNLIDKCEIAWHPVHETVNRILNAVTILYLMFCVCKCLR